MRREQSYRPYARSVRAGEARSSAGQLRGASHASSGPAAKGSKAMRGPTKRRLFFAALFALLAGFIVAWSNPVDHVEADLRADTHGLKHSLRLAAHDL